MKAIRKVHETISFIHEEQAGGEDSAHPSIVKPAATARKDSQAPKDLMISYSHADKEMMLKLRGKCFLNLS